MTWEVKEGRMFVYELLCKHLIEFHTASADRGPSAPPPSLLSACSQDGGRYVSDSHLAVVIVGQSRLLALVLE